jgi:transposase
MDLVTHFFPHLFMRTRHGITQVRGFKRILRSSHFHSFLAEHPQAQKRWSVLRPILDGTITIEQAAATFCCSEKTIDRWKAQYDPVRWYSLLPRSRSPKSAPRKLTPLARRQRVITVANDHPAWGAPKIHAYIRQEVRALVHHRRDIRGRTIKRVKNSTDPASAPGERVHCLATPRKWPAPKPRSTARCCFTLGALSSPISSSTYAATRNGERSSRRHPCRSHQPANRSTARAYASRVLRLRRTQRTAATLRTMKPITTAFALALAVLVNPQITLASDYLFINDFDLHDFDDEIKSTLGYQFGAVNYFSEMATITDEEKSIRNTFEPLGCFPYYLTKGRRERRCRL